MTDTAPQKLAFIGAGNMAEALIKGILQAGQYSAEHIIASDISDARREYMHSTYGIKVTDSNQVAVSGSTIIIMAVKPQMMAAALEGTDGVITENHLIVSIAAGLPTSYFENKLTAPVRVVRVMPNTPALVLSGIAGVCGGSRAKEEDLVVAQELLSAVGSVVRVQEDDMDAVTAVSGSGPAYAFYLMESMTRAAVDMGLEVDTARMLVNNTVRGAAELILATGEDAGELRKKVTSKGGTTEAALNVMNEHGVGDAVVSALKAAAERSRELAGNL